MSIADVCSQCRRRLEVGESAWWDAETYEPCCPHCHAQSAWIEHEHAFHSTPRRLEPDAERAVAGVLDRAVGGLGHCLHGRQHPISRGVLDHVVVSPSGVLVVDTRRDSGAVESLPTRPLLVGGRDRSRMLHTVARHAAAVRDVLDDLDHGDVFVHGLLCLVGVTWPADGPVVVDGFAVTGPAALVPIVRRSGPLTEEARAAVAVHLSVALPSHRRQGAPHASS